MCVFVLFVSELKDRAVNEAEVKSQNTVMMQVWLL